MYIETVTIIILLVIATNFYSRFKKLENEVDQLKNKISHLENDIDNLDKPDEEEFVKKETENWIELRKHLNRLIGKNEVSKREVDNAWNNATKDMMYILSLEKFVKIKEKDLPAKDRFAGLLFEEEMYDEYLFTKIMKNLDMKLNSS